jgi:hypothetical protein
VVAPPPIPLDEVVDDEDIDDEVVDDELLAPTCTRSCTSSSHPP